MEPVDLLQCSRCKLAWVRETELIPGVCPACRLQYTVPKGPVTVLGRQVPVASIMAYGWREGLLDPQVRRGLDVLRLGDRCEHNYICRSICPTCCA